MWIEFTSQNELTVHHATYILTALPVRSGIVDIKNGSEILALKI